MGWSRCLVPAVVVGVLGVPCPALGDEGACSPMSIEADAGVLGRWPALPSRVREAFSGRSDVDACARVTLTSKDRSIAVAVVLPDGRSASRSVARSVDVVPTLEALLLVPRRELTASASDLPSVPSAPEEPLASAPLLGAASTGAQAVPGDRAVAVNAGESATGPVPDHVSNRVPDPVSDCVSNGVPDRVSNGVPNRVSNGDLSARAVAEPPGRLGFELSVVTGARIGAGQTSLGLGGLTFLDIHGWLAGFEGRADAYRGTDGGPPFAALELATLGGKRFRFGSLSLDLTAGPALALRGGVSETSVAAAPSGAGSAQAQTMTPSNSTSFGAMPRLLAGTRVNFRARSVFRVFVGVDGELGPASNPAPELPPGAARLPVWTVGLALGATVGTL